MSSFYWLSLIYITKQYSNQIFSEIFLLDPKFCKHGLFLWYTIYDLLILCSIIYIIIWINFCPVVYLYICYLLYNSFHWFSSKFHNTWISWCYALILLAPAEDLVVLQAFLVALSPLFSTRKNKNKHTQFSIEIGSNNIFRDK